MKINVISVQYGDEIITNNISRAWRENFARGLELLVHFQINLGSRVIGGFSSWLLLVASLGSILLNFLR